MHISGSRTLLACAVPLALASALLGVASSATAVPGVTPSSYAAALAPGDSVSIKKIVETPAIPPNPDIVFLADTTGSMAGSIANVKANAATILSQIKAAQPTAQFAVAEYKDEDSGDPYAYRRNTQLTSVNADVIAGINQWSASGGGDLPEAWIGALGTIPGDISFRPDGTRVIVMFGDAPSHDPSLGYTQASAISGLQGADISVIAINVPPSGLDSLGQASAVTSATGGQLAAADPNQVSATILSELQNLPATVTHAVTCDDGITATLSPASKTVTSGGTVTFDETIALGADAPQGETVSCEVQFLVNGSLPGPEFVQAVDIEVLDVTPPVVTVESKTVEATSPAGANVSYNSSATDNVDGPLVPTCAPPSGSLFALGATTVNCEATDAAGNTGYGSGTITVVDTTPPSVACPESTNPGGYVPAAGGGAAGQNPDGFYQLNATDVVDTDPQVYLRDTGSGTVFGPYDSGQRIKYTQAASGPSETLMRSGIIWIKGTGDAELFAVDFSGNSATPVACLVPRPPK